MKYLSADPFIVGGLSDQYRKEYERIFRTASVAQTAERPGDKRKDGGAIPLTGFRKRVKE